jgi:type I restriction enzyme S subunit
MKKYDNYKDCGVEWIGEIPKNWSVTKLKFISNIYNGNSLNDDLKEKYESEDLNFIPYVSTKDVEPETGNVNLNNGIRIPKNEGNFKIAPSGSFVLCIEGGSAGKKIGYLKEDVYFVNKLACFDYNNKFLYYYALSDNFKNQFFNSLSGLIGGVSISIIRNFFSPFPSLAEQTQIASFLDYKTNLIDATIEKKKRLIELLKEKRQAVINEAVTKGLNPNAPMKDSGVEWLGDIPEHWEVKKMRYLCDITTGGKDTENREDDGKYPFFVRSQTIERISTFSFDGEAILTAGDGVGVCKVWHYINDKFDFHQRVYMMYNFREVTGKYLYEYIRENFVHEVLKLSAKSTVDSLRRPMFLNFTVVVPPISEQIEIVSLIENQKSLIDMSIKKLEIQIEKLQNYRQSLISEAVTGKIDVRDWRVN